ncbi:MAG: hypothetical protein BA863_01800 [Desulfovibrio sp. S3730MH75]|nr:MAG: hypothetical protein BA863_01800 [Desulfovibrio sp. S3730MH75]
MSRACSAEILDVLKAHRFVFERRIEGDKEVMDALECFQPAMYKLITADLKTARSEPKVS